MSLFRKIFGRETADELEQAAERAAANGEYGSAKLTFERAIERAEDAATRDRLATRVEAMRDAIAKNRIAEAKRLLEGGFAEQALIEASGAAEVANDPAVRAIAEKIVETIRDDAVMGTIAEIPARTHAELLAAASAGWSDEQSTEYEDLGEPLFDAMVDLEAGRFERAHARLEELLAKSSDARWLHRDVARARWATGDAEGAHAAMKAFFENVSGEEHDRALFESRLDHARLLDELGRREEAIAEVELALDHVGDSARNFVAVARFLRERGHAEEAFQILESSLGLPNAESDAVVQIEIGFVESELGRTDDALARLERTVLAIRQQGFEPPREVEGARAKLLERVGRREHAAELYRRLALASSDVLAFEHALEAARLHASLGHRAEAARLFDRAQAIAPDETRKAQATERRAVLDAP